MAASLSSPSLAARASHSSSRLLAVRRHGDGKVASGCALRPVCQAVPTRRVATRAAAVREEELCRTETVTYPSGAVSTSASKKTITVRDEDLKSTWEHRAWVWGTSALLAKPFVQGLLAASHDSAAAGVFALALGASYFLSGATPTITSTHFFTPARASPSLSSEICGRRPLRAHYLYRR